MIPIVICLLRVALDAEQRGFLCFADDEQPGIFRRLSRYSPVDGFRKLTALEQVDNSDKRLEEWLNGIRNDLRAKTEHHAARFKLRI